MAKQNDNKNVFGDGSIFLSPNIFFVAKLFNDGSIFLLPNCVVTKANNLAMENMFPSSKCFHHQTIRQQNTLSLPIMWQHALFLLFEPHGNGNVFLSPNNLVINCDCRHQNYGKKQVLKLLFCFR
jgi:hypothetical protein